MKDIYKMLVIVRMVILTGAISLILSGCYITNINLVNPPEQKNIEKNPGGVVLNQSEKFPSMWFGIKALKKPVEPSCAEEQKVEKVIYKTDLLDNVIHFLIGGIYTRRTIEIYCG
ncbi:MAG: hypothetical protein OEZ34_06605 [Spirochaetia bacterium]|nr:hypothetical protein [Spirochaetia bacterium]